MSRYALVLVILLCPYWVLSQEWKPIDTSSSELVTLKSNLASMETISGDIRQEKSFAFLNNKLVSEGRFYFKKENKLRWAFDEPVEYIILINESSMRLKEDGEEKKYKGMNQILRQVKEIILGCIDGSIMSSSNYRTAFSSNGEIIRIQLEPKAKNLKEFITQIEVDFIEKGSVLKHVKLTDPSGDLTEIHFSNLKSNQQIDESLFVDF